MHKILGLNKSMKPAMLKEFIRFSSPSRRRRPQRRRRQLNRRQWRRPRALHGQNHRLGLHRDFGPSGHRKGKNAGKTQSYGNLFVFFETFVHIDRVFPGCVLGERSESGVENGRPPRFHALRRRRIGGQTRTGERKLLITMISLS